MRGVIVAMIVLVLVVIYQLVATVAIEPLISEVRAWNIAAINGSGALDSLSFAVFVLIPMVLVFGLGIVWAAAWYIRRERARGVVRGP